MGDGIFLEIPIFSQASTDLVSHSGHGTCRLELNDHGSYPQGGTTPALAAYNHGLATNSDSPLRIMIRPRGPPEDGSPDFVYSNHEFHKLMVQAVMDWKASGVMIEQRGDGFVFGVLKDKLQNGGKESTREPSTGMVVDVERCSQLVQLAAPYPCVFHRAFDDILGSAGSTVEDALTDLAVCGFAGLLTSGGPGRAIDNVDTVSRIIRAAPTTLREVVVGGGVRSTNLRELRRTLPKARSAPRLNVWFHSSCLTEPSLSDVVDEEELRLIAEQVKDAKMRES